MVRAMGWTTGIALLALVGQAQAQIVHKCIVNGAAVYQAAACPAADEQKSLVIPAPPSQQELLDATANGRLRSVQPGANAPVPATTTSRRYDRNKTLMIELTPSRQEPEAAPASNCDQLNQAWHDAQYRREELSAPGAGSTRPAALQRAIDDMNRAQERASNSHCQLR